MTRLPLSPHPRFGGMVSIAEADDSNPVTWGFNPKGFLIPWVQLSQHSEGLPVLANVPR